MTVRKVPRFARDDRRFAGTIHADALGPSMAVTMSGVGWAPLACYGQVRAKRDGYGEEPLSLRESAHSTLVLCSAYDISRPRPC